MSQDKTKSHIDHPHSEPKKNRGEEEFTKRHVYVESGVQIDFVQDLRKKYDATQKENTTHSNKILFWTKISAFLLFIYAAVTGWQGCLTRQIITNNINQFQQDQRPYLWIMGYIDPSSVHIAENQKMWINLLFVNYGKSPAMRQNSTGKIFIGPNAIQQADAWFASLGDGPLATEPDVETILPPGIPADRDKPFGGYTTLISDNVLSARDVDYILHTEESVAIVMRMQYFDLAGTRYWSDYCISRYVAGSFPSCPRHNEIH